MEEYEQKYLDIVLDNQAANIASDLRARLVSEDGDRVLESQEELTLLGRVWVQGYLTGRLSALRGSSGENPNIPEDDLDEIRGLLEHREAEIASHLYS